MKRIWVMRMCFLLILLAVGCIGCGETAQTEEESNPYAGAVSMESTPVINYIVPQLSPNILINQKGYSVGCEKEASVTGKSIPASYQVVDAETEEIIYSKTFEKVIFNEELKLYTGVAVFSDLNQEGSYYLECDKLGRSYTFEIKKDLYSVLLQEIYEEMLQACREQTITTRDITVLLTAYEWYPEVFPDEDANEIPDVMEAVASWIAACEKKETEDEHETIYVAALAKFSYLYQKYDMQYATECLQHASVVFSKMQASLGRSADNFYALTEIYRATGLYTYRNQILNYASFFQGNTSYLGEASYLYGAMTYLVTRQRVDVSLCNIFMGDIMDRGEEVSNLYEDMIHPVTAKNNGVEDLLARAQELFCCNYVLNNYQYTHIIEEFLDYLMGRNREAVCFYPGEQTQSGYLLLLSQLTATMNRR